MSFLAPLIEDSSVTTKPLAQTATSTLTPLSSTQLILNVLNRLTFGTSIQSYYDLSAQNINTYLSEQLNPSSLVDPVADLPLDRYDYTLEEVQTWWLDKMHRSERQLLEKMTFFWHNFFATGNFRVQNPYMMYVQNQTLRTNALTSFRALLTKMAKDPAMLIWLNGHENNAGPDGQGGNYTPNENFSREVLQRFSMGGKSVTGRSIYSEVDIHEGARAWSGWMVNPEPPYAVTFSAARHDSNEKVFLGSTIPATTPESGWQDSTSMVNIIMSYPSLEPGISQCAYWVCRRLLQFFVTQGPTDEYIYRIAQSFGPDGNIKAVLNAIFASPEFSSTNMFHGITKGPVEHYLSVIRLLDLDFDQADHARYLDTLKVQGHELLNPSSVFGWPGGAKWINFPSLMDRIALTTSLIAEPKYDPVVLGQQVRLTNPTYPAKEVFQMLQKLTLQGVAPTGVTNPIYNYLIAAPLNQATCTSDPERMEGLLTLLMVCPEFTQY